ncbi:hypothetical protein HPB51_004422 [Rhipicephalus microplus]|uniref:Uncharacterized protein n=1 Tax=Rhipicephalus microplus TaxID=6941 RepID=A0A9J6EM40_RHIMP|nr:hypothetical protein HPB51_004422 [Rhipicephalus microplus]
MDAIRFLSPLSLSLQKSKQSPFLPIVQVLPSHFRAACGTAWGDSPQSPALAHDGRDRSTGRVGVTYALDRDVIVQLGLRPLPNSRPSLPDELTRAAVLARRETPRETPPPAWLRARHGSDTHAGFGPSLLLQACHFEGNRAVEEVADWEQMRDVRKNTYPDFSWAAVAHFRSPTARSGDAPSQHSRALCVLLEFRNDAELRSVPTRGMNTESSRRVYPWGNPVRPNGIMADRILLSRRTHPVFLWVDVPSSNGVPLAITAFRDVYTASAVSTCGGIILVAAGASRYSSGLSAVDFASPLRAFIHDRLLAA